MYQSRRLPFCNKENYNDRRVSRAVERVKNRRLSRQKNFTSNRVISDDLINTESDEDKVPENVSRIQKLIQWKKEKDQIKKIEQEKKAKEKPPFKCGVVHHKPPPVLENVCRRSVRIKSKQIPVNNVKKINAKPSETAERRRNYRPSSFIQQGSSFAPTAHQFKAPSNLPKIEEQVMSASQFLETEDDKASPSMCLPAQFSPWISRIRGSIVDASTSDEHGTPQSSKRSGSSKKMPEVSKATPDDLRKVVVKRVFNKSLRTPDEPEKGRRKVLSKTNTPVLSKEDAENFQNFRSLYEGEMDRLNKLCSQWESLLSSEASQDIPNEVQNGIFATVGQTRLLMREKLAQFNDLLQKFQFKKSSPVITSSDLQGFWDLVSIQINDVDTKFNSLDALKWNNWVGTEKPKSSPVKAKVQRRGVSKKNPKTKSSNGAKSSFRAFMAERKKNDEIKAETATVAFGFVNMNIPNEERSSGIMNTPKHTPLTILKKESNRRMSVGRRVGQQEDRGTPRRSSKRVTFADSTPGGDSPKPQIRRTPHARRFKDALLQMIGPKT